MRKSDPLYKLSLGGNMKLHKFFIFFLIFCLAGCSLDGIVQETTDPNIETILPMTVQTEQPTTSATTTPTEIPTVPKETQLPTTEPPQSETIPPQVIVQPEPSDEDFVKVKAYIPDIFVDLRYSTENNFTNQKIYDFTDVWLRYGTIKKLVLVQEELKQNGLFLKIWDGFRPPSAQFKLWDICPNPTYVSNPNNGFSSHSRGNTVDITLVYADGTELVMPTEFDDFSKLADRDYSDCNNEAATNAVFLEQLMIKHGFRPYFGEWWHFTDTQSYSVDESFEPLEAALHYANCNEYISLRTKPSTTSDVITRILVGEQFQVVASYGNFAIIEYNNLSGYVLCRYIQPIN